MTTNSPLGDTQKHILTSMLDHKLYHARCGWVWDTHGGTVRVLDSLHKRGLVEVHHWGPGRWGKDRRAWRLSRRGVDVAMSLRPDLNCQEGDADTRARTHYFLESGHSYDGRQPDRVWQLLDFV